MARFQRNNSGLEILPYAHFGSIQLFPSVFFFIEQGNRPRDSNPGVRISQDAEYEIGAIMDSLVGPMGTVHLSLVIFCFQLSTRPK